VLKITRASKQVPEYCQFLVEAVRLLASQDCESWREHAAGHGRAGSRLGLVISRRIEALAERLVFSVAAFTGP
jgi:hypothetical protein